MTKSRAAFATGYDRPEVENRLNRKVANVPGIIVRWDCYVRKIIFVTKYKNNL